MPETYRLKFDVRLDLHRTLYPDLDWTHVFTGIDDKHRSNIAYIIKPYFEIAIITEKVSNGDPYKYEEEKGEYAVGLWVNKMKNQLNLSVVEIRILTFIENLQTRIDLSIPRRKWPGLLFDII